MASKRGAEVQMGKDGGFAGDGSDNVASDAPTRATPAQLARRKIAATRGTPASKVRRPAGTSFQPTGNGFGNSQAPGAVNDSGFQSNASNEALKSMTFGRQNNTQQASSFGGFGGGGNSMMNNNPTSAFGGGHAQSTNTFAPPSSSFEFSTNGSNPFAASIDNSHAPSTISYSGSLFSLAQTKVPTKPHNLPASISSDHHRGTHGQSDDKNDQVSNPQPAWAPNSPWLQDQNGVNGGTTAEAVQSTEQKVNAFGNKQSAVSHQAPLFGSISGDNSSKLSTYQPTPGSFASSNNTNMFGATNSFMQQQSSVNPFANLMQAQASPASAPSGNIFGSLAQPSQSSFNSSGSAFKTSNQQQQQPVLAGPSIFSAHTEQQQPSTSAQTNIFGGVDNNSQKEKSGAAQSNIFGGSSQSQQQNSDAPQSNVFGGISSQQQGPAATPSGSVLGAQTAASAPATSLFNFATPTAVSSAGPGSNYSSANLSTTSDKTSSHAKPTNGIHSHEDSQSSHTKNLSKLGENSPATRPFGLFAEPTTSTNSFSNSSTMSPAASLNTTSTTSNLFNFSNQPAATASDEPKVSSKPMFSFQTEGGAPSSSNPFTPNATRTPQGQAQSTLANDSSHTAAAPETQVLLNATPNSNIFAQKPFAASTGQPDSSMALKPFSSEKQNEGATRKAAVQSDEAARALAPGIAPKPSINGLTQSSGPDRQYEDAAVNNLIPTQAQSKTTVAIDSHALKQIKAQCLSLLPEDIPAHLGGDQREEYLFAYRLMSLQKGLNGFVASVTGYDADYQKASKYYEEALRVVYEAAGVKRTAAEAELLAVQRASKRVNTNGPVITGAGSRPPLFGNLRPDKRKSSEDRVDATQKKHKNSEVSYPDLSGGGSKTSQLFSAITNSPSKSQDSSATQPGGFKPSAMTSPAPFPNTFGQADNDVAASKNQTSKMPVPPTAPTFKPNVTGASSTGSPFKMPNAPNLPSASTSGSSFFAQFAQNAKANEEKAMLKRMEEDKDSDEDEEEWKARDAEMQKQKKAEAEAAAANAPKPPTFNVAAGGGFLSQFGKAPAKTPNTLVEGANNSVSSTGADLLRTSSPNAFAHLSKTASDAEGSKTGDADNEESDDSGSDDGEIEGGEGGKKRGNGEGDGDNHDGSEETTRAAAPSEGRSIFDRITKDEHVKPVHETAPSSTLTSTNLFSASPASFGSATSSTPKPTSSNPFATSLTSFGSPTSTTPKAASSNPFATSLASFGSGKSTSPAGDHTWKPETPIKFSSSIAAPSLSLTAPSPSKAPVGKPLSNLFGASKTDTAPNSSASNIFGHLATGTSNSSSAGFNFGANLNPGGSVFASATSSRGTSPGATTADDSAAEGASETQNDEQLDLTSNRPGEDDEDVLFKVKAKAIEFERDDPTEEKTWIVRALGELRVLFNKKTNRTRMLMRAGPSHKIALNARVDKNVTYKKEEGGKHVSFLMPKEGGASKWLLRIKSEEDVDELVKILESKKN